jgi:hypothetical protein
MEVGIMMSSSSHHLYSLCASCWMFSFRSMLVLRPPKGYCDGALGFSEPIEPAWHTSQKSWKAERGICVTVKMQNVAENEQSLSASPIRKERAAVAFGVRGKVVQLRRKTAS